MNKQDMRSIESVYEEYDTQGNEKQLEECIDYFLHAMDEFIRTMGYEGKVTCNEAILNCAVLGCFSDIDRLKTFHGITNPNAFKTAAYETQWLLKRRALQSDDPNICFANEEFALSHIMRFLYGNKQFEEKAAISDNEELQRFHASLHYHLKYRDCDAKTLELMLLAFRAGEVLAAESDKLTTVQDPKLLVASAA